MGYLPFVLAILIIAIPVLKCSEPGRDGFNFYKDYLRTRSEEKFEDAPLPEKMLYFYRTPVQFSDSVITNTDQEYGKRTGNAFKNHMLNKEWLGEIPKKLSTYILIGQKPYNIVKNYSNDETNAPTFQY